MKKNFRFSALLLLLAFLLGGGLFLALVEIPAPTRLQVKELDGAKYLP